MTRFSTPSTPIILQVLPKLESGGVERGTIEITDAIQKSGMHAIVVSSGGALISHITHAGGEHVVMPVHRKNPFVIWRNSQRLYHLIRERNISLVHARSRAPAWAAYLAAQKAGVPFITTFHGVYGNRSKLKRFYNSVMVKGERVIAISRFVAEHIIATYDVDRLKIRLIERGADAALFNGDKLVSERIASLTQSWRLPDEHIAVIFCPGRISRIKGQHVLVEALAQLKDMDFLCIIAGKDEGHEEYRMALEKQIIDSGLEGKVRLADATTYMPEAYTLSHLVVVPSAKPEAFGRVAIEAQAMGKCVVATDHGGAQETIVNNETGYLVPPNNPTAMAAAIRFALTRDAAMIDAMALYAMRHVREHFSVQQMKDKTIAVYRELVKQ